MFFIDGAHGHARSGHTQVEVIIFGQAEAGAEALTCRFEGLSREGGAGVGDEIEHLQQSCREGLEQGFRASSWLGLTEQSHSCVNQLELVGIQQLQAAGGPVWIVEIVAVEGEQAGAAGQGYGPVTSCADAAFVIS